MNTNGGGTLAQSVGYQAFVLNDSAAIVGGKGRWTGITNFRQTGSLKERRLA